MEHKIYTPGDKQLIVDGIAPLICNDFGLHLAQQKLILTCHNSVQDLEPMCCLFVPIPMHRNMIEYFIDGTEQSNDMGQAVGRLGCGIQS